MYDWVLRMLIRLVDSMGCNVGFGLYEVLEYIYLKYGMSVLFFLILFN